jgi:hypothetical protein
MKLAIRIETSAPEAIEIAIATLQAIIDRLTESGAPETNGVLADTNGRNIGRWEFEPNKSKQGK